MSTQKEVLIRVWTHGLNVYSRILEKAIAERDNFLASAIVPLQAKSDENLREDVFEFQACYKQSMIEYAADMARDCPGLPLTQWAPFEIPASLDRQSIYDLWMAYYAWDYQDNIDNLTSEVNKCELALEAINNDFWEDSMTRSDIHEVRNQEKVVKTNRVPHINAALRRGDKVMINTKRVKNVGVIRAEFHVWYVDGTEENLGFDGYVFIDFSQPAKKARKQHAAQ